MNFRINAIKYIHDVTVNLQRNASNYQYHVWLVYFSDVFIYGKICLLKNDRNVFYICFINLNYYF
ncbi:hypothetical protein SAMN05421821_108231 [Mucilaginibacter lappiensis]|uniref:Uncharacterized protein n=1 Tax=Mucilaginibacter lappiensis TaxID=354630 RepID=A0ABR6PJL9_9SPHI|nr:hypothetical protein [Mucilaginibacter lappiensis]SIR56687.1 hypothetical protein SAMN05421821_108231 [Mucilaginibacter lappiensis]